MFWHSEPLSLLSLTFRVVSSVLAFGAIIITSVSAIRAKITSQIDAQSHIFNFGVQSHHCRILGFGIQSHHRIFIRRSGPSLISISVQSHHCRILGFGNQSHHHFLVWRSKSLSQFWCSEPSSLPSLTFRVAFSVSAFRAIISFQFWRSEPSLSHSRFWCSEPSSLPSLTFRFAFLGLALRATIHSRFLRSEPSSSLLSLAFRVAFSVSTFRANVSFFHSAFRAVVHPHSAFRATVSSRLRCSESSFSTWHS